MSAADTATPIRVALIIEDEEDVAKWCQLVLEQRNIASWIASNLHAGLEANERYEFDFMIVDLNLPDSGGLETVKKLPMDIPVVVMSSLSDQEVEECLRAGAVAFIHKGFKVEEQLGTVLELILKRTSADRRHKKACAELEQAKVELKRLEKKGASAPDMKG